MGTQKNEATHKQVRRFLSGRACLSPELFCALLHTFIMKVNEVKLETAVTLLKFSPSCQQGFLERKLLNEEDDNLSDSLGCMVSEKETSDIIECSKMLIGTHDFLKENTFSINFLQLLTESWSVQEPKSEENLQEEICRLSISQLLGKYNLTILYDSGKVTCFTDCLFESFARYIEKYPHMFKNLKLSLSEPSDGSKEEHGVLPSQCEASEPRDNYNFYKGHEDVGVKDYLKIVQQLLHSQKVPEPSIRSKIEVL